MKALGIFFLLVFSSLPVLAEDLSCPPEESSNFESLSKAIYDRLMAGTLSSEYCNEYSLCMTGNSNSSSASVCASNAYSDIFTGSLKLGNCNMDLQERKVLTDYMGNLYGCMNSALYSNKGISYPNLNSSLNSALKRFPAYEGFVFRGSTFPSAVLARHQVGTTITYPAYTSSSTNPSTAKNFGPHQFLIYSKSGRPVMGRSGGGSEREVLFTAGTKFRVLRVKKPFYFLREVAGTETKAQQKAEDDRILKLAREAKEKFDSSSPGTPDTWSCPLDDKKIPLRLVQKTIPDVSEFIN